jgi:hypothetical protein
MLIDCDTCTARGTGCADCVVTVLLGAPPGWNGSDPVVVPMTTRARPAAGPPAQAPAHRHDAPVRPARPAAPAAGPAWEGVTAEDALAAVPAGDATAEGMAAEDVVVPPPGVVVDFDEVERRAVRALSAAGLVPPLRHRPRTDGGPGTGHGRRTG